MSFSKQIKYEILEQEFTISQARAFIDGVVSASSIREGSSLILRFNNKYTLENIKYILDNIFIEHESVKENKNWIKLKKYKKVDEIRQPSYYFAGVFVGGGSISDVNSNSYHLELQLNSHSNAIKIQTYLNKYNFNFNLIQRRKKYVLYLKKTEHISDFLKAIKSVRALMDFEDARILRDMYDYSNKYSNLDVYNQKKLALYSDEFKTNFNFLKENKLLLLFREMELIFFKIKLENPYSSLVELRDIYEEKTGIVKTKSALNHWIIKLRKIVAKYDN